MPGGAKEAQKKGRERGGQGTRVKQGGAQGAEGGARKPKTRIPVPDRDPKITRTLSLTLGEGTRCGL